MEEFQQLGSGLRGWKGYRGSKSKENRSKIVL